MTAEQARPRTADVVVDRDIAVVAQTTPATNPLRWGPIVAGFLGALGLFFLLSLLAVTIGASVITPDGNRPTLIATVVASVIALVSFFAGGFVASWAAEVRDGTRGALNGFLVWTLWLLLVLLAGGLGLGALFGAPGSMLTDISAPELTRQELVDALAAGSWRSFLALALAAASAALGGAVGAHPRLHREQRWIG